MGTAREKSSKTSHKLPSKKMHKNSNLSLFTTFGGIYSEDRESGGQERGQKEGHPGTEHSGCVTLVKWPNFSEPPCAFVKENDGLHTTGHL